MRSFLPYLPFSDADKAASGTPPVFNSSRLRVGVMAPWKIFTSQRAASTAGRTDRSGNEPLRDDERTEWATDVPFLLSNAVPPQRCRNLPATDTGVSAEGVGHSSFVSTFPLPRDACHYHRHSRSRSADYSGRLQAGIESVGTRDRQYPELAGVVRGYKRTVSRTGGRKRSPS